MLLGRPAAGDEAGAGEERYRQDDRAAVAIDETGEAHDPIVTAAPSGRPF